MPAKKKTAALDGKDDVESGSESDASFGGTQKNATALTTQTASTSSRTSTSAASNSTSTRSTVTSTGTRTSTTTGSATTLTSNNSSVATQVTGTTGVTTTTGGSTSGVTTTTPLTQPRLSTRTQQTESLSSLSGSCSSSSSSSGDVGLHQILQQAYKQKESISMSALADIPHIFLYDRSNWAEFKKVLNECGGTWQLPHWMTTIVRGGEEWEAMKRQGHDVDSIFPTGNGNVHDREFTGMISREKKKNCAFSFYAFVSVNDRWTLSGGWRPHMCLTNSLSYV